MTNNKIKKIVLFIASAVLCAFLYRHSPRKIEFLGHYDKIGAHRVNTLDKLDNSLGYFEAIEVDLLFDEKTTILDVVHPPSPSIGLSFTKYMNALGDTKPFLWLDIKNLEKDNASAILSQLNKIVQSSAYPKERILIETRYPEALPLFAATGYKTSYYLPQQLYKQTEKELEATKKSINAILLEQPELGISTSYEDYKIIQQNFPSRKKYLWSLSNHVITDYSLVQEFLRDPNVALVLVRYHPLF